MFNHYIRYKYVRDVHYSFLLLVAAKTAIIRNLYQHYHKYPLDKRTKIYYFDLIQKRKSRLKYLRKYDYKSFEWILDQLDLMYKPYP